MDDRTGLDEVRGTSPQGGDDDPVRPQGGDDDSARPQGGDDDSVWAPHGDGGRTQPSADGDAGPDASQAPAHDAPQAPAHDASQTRAPGGPSAEPAAPKPPPSSWSSDNEGPGSPAGSVRPPDTTGTADASEPSSQPRRGIAMVLVAALVGAVLGTAGTLALARTTLDATPPPVGEVRAPTVEVEGDGATTVVPAVAEAVTPSVVRVDRIQDNELGAMEQGLGSGVIYRSDGYIITNNHVVEGADALRVIFANGESAEARIVGTDRLTDVAVLRVDRSDLPAVNIRDGQVVVGETVIAIGAPFGLNASVTAGVVSAVERDLEIPIDEGVISIPNVVQTDAAINPGNSGGALVDANGELIGINTAILATTRLGQTAGNVGIGFAISAGDAVGVADSLIDQGFVRHARLGIQGGTITESVAREYGLETEEGVLIASVEPEGPADAAGLQAEDVIIEAEGEPIAGMSDLVGMIRARDPGDVLALVVVRGGEEIEIDAELGEWQ
jgi:serine protease Do